MTTIEKKYQEKCATPSDINEHLPTLRRYAECCFHVTELGVRAIVSTWAFLAAKPEFLISVDRIDPKDSGGDLDEVIRAAEEVGIDFTFVQADDLQIELEETDLLFIDTWHVYDQLRAELELHSIKARKFIILHDTTTFETRGENEGHRGLGPALQEFLLANRDKWRVKEKVANNNGLTVLERVCT